MRLLFAFLLALAALFAGPPRRVVSQTVDGERKEHRFIRADKFTDIEQAHDMALQKGRLIIDQQAGSLFS